MGPVEAGTEFGGCLIEELIGRGGMGVVYRARQLELNRAVAIKLIAPERTGEATARERFLREAHAAAAVEHPNVLPVYRAGIEDGQAYLVMRYVAGEDLRTLVRANGRCRSSRRWTSSPRWVRRLTRSTGRGSCIATSSL